MSKTLRITSNQMHRINMFLDGEQIVFNESPVDAINTLTYMGKPLGLANSMINATLPHSMRLLCEYKQTEISLDSNGACIFCNKPKKEHKVG